MEGWLSSESAVYILRTLVVVEQRRVVPRVPHEVARKLGPNAVDALRAHDVDRPAVRRQQVDERDVVADDAVCAVRLERAFVLAPAPSDRDALRGVGVGACGSQSTPG